jgi:hypothetical protein
MKRLTTFILASFVNAVLDDVVPLLELHEKMVCLIRIWEWSISHFTKTTLYCNLSVYGF